MDSRRFCIDPNVGRLGRRLRGTWFFAFSMMINRSNAASRFCGWDRRSVPMTTVPEGGWESRTPVSRLLRCWPPGPLSFTNSTVHSVSRMSRSVEYGGGRCETSSMIPQRSALIAGAISVATSSRNVSSCGPNLPATVQSMSIWPMISVVAGLRTSTTISDLVSRLHAR